MGAWGLGIFQSDHDYDQVDEFIVQTGVDKLQEQTIANAKAKGMKVKDKRDQSKPKPNEIDIHFSVYVNLCDNAPIVRKYLEAGPFRMLMDKYEALLPPADHSGYHLDGYKFVLLGACGMGMGCTITGHHRELMKKYYKKVGFMRDAVKQLEKGIDIYINGLPYDFGSKGLHETLAAEGPPMEDRLGPGSINVQPPGPSSKEEATEEAVRLTKLDLVGMAENKFNYDVCGACGAGKGEGGGVLLHCGKCKMRKYCGKECQKKHWKLHKQVCGKKQAYQVIGDGKSTKSAMTGYV